MIKKRFLRSTLIAALLVAMTLSNANALTSAVEGEISGQFTARGALHISASSDGYFAAARTIGTMAGCDNIACYVTVTLVAYNTKLFPTQTASNAEACTDPTRGYCSTTTPTVSQINAASAGGTHTVSTTDGTATYSWNDYTSWQKPEGIS